MNFCIFQFLSSTPKPGCPQLTRRRPSSPDTVKEEQTSATTRVLSTSAKRRKTKQKQSKTSSAGKTLQVKIAKISQSKLESSRKRKSHSGAEKSSIDSEVITKEQSENRIKDGESNSKKQKLSVAEVSVGMKGNVVKPKLSSMNLEKSSRSQPLVDRSVNNSTTVNGLTGSLSHTSVKDRSADQSRGQSHVNSLFYFDKKKDSTGNNSLYKSQTVANKTTSASHSSNTSQAKSAKKSKHTINNSSHKPELSMNETSSVSLAKEKTTKGSARRASQSMIKNKQALRSGSKSKIESTNKSRNKKENNSSPVINSGLSVSKAGNASKSLNKTRTKASRSNSKKSKDTVANDKVDKNKVLIGRAKGNIETTEEIRKAQNRNPKAVRKVRRRKSEETGDRSDESAASEGQVERDNESDNEAGKYFHYSDRT